MARNGYSKVLSTSRLDICLSSDYWNKPDAQGYFNIVLKGKDIGALKTQAFGGASDIGYFLYSPYQGFGYMTEALTGVISAELIGLRFRRLHISERNWESNITALKSGFVLTRSSHLEGNLWEHPTLLASQGRY